MQMLRNALRVVAAETVSALRMPSWVLPALLLSLATGGIGCGERAGGSGARWALPQCRPPVGDGLTNVLSSTLGATLSDSSPFHAPPNDGGVLLSCQTRQGYAAAAGTAMPQWITYNLGAPVPVQAAAIAWYSPRDYGRDFRIEGRRDSRDPWRPLAEMRDNAEMLWQSAFAPTEIGQVRLTVESAAGQGRTLIKCFYLFSAKPRITENVAVTAAGLRIQSASPFHPPPNDPSAMFTGRIGAVGSRDYAAGLPAPLPQWVAFSLPERRTIGAVGVVWYDSHNYASHFRLEVERQGAWEPILEVTDGEDVGGFYVLDKPCTERTFRLLVYSAHGQPRLLARQLALYGLPPCKKMPD